MSGSRESNGSVASGEWRMASGVHGPITIRHSPFATGVDPAGWGGKGSPAFMTINKALITAAGRTQRSLPLQSLVDRDGETKSALRIIIDEAVAAGIEDIGVVVAPGDADTFRSAAGNHAARLQFLEQTDPRGFGHAVLTGRTFTGDAPFLLLVGDHLYVSREVRSCARQLVEVATAQGCSVSAVQGTHESKL